MKVWIVGDGHRDKAMLPPLLRSILEVELNCEFKTWRDVRLRKGGYDNKLAYFMRQILATRKPWRLVAVVDADGSPRGRRLNKLKTKREEERQKQNHPIPTALGEAFPHGEAWLLDDSEAVKKGLNLDADHKVPTATSGSPKKIMHELLAASPKADERPIDVWPDIAHYVRLKSCRTPKKTGFGPFCEDVLKELKPMAADKTDLP